MSPALTWPRAARVVVALDTSSSSGSMPTSLRRLRVRERGVNERCQPDAEDGRDLLVTHALKADEQDRRRALPEIWQSRARGRAIRAAVLGGAPLSAGVVVIQSDRNTFAYRSSNIIDILVVQDRKQPRSQVGPILPQVQFADGASKAVLDEIVGSADISG